MKINDKMIYNFLFTKLKFNISIDIDKLAPHVQDYITRNPGIIDKIKKEVAKLPLAPPGAKKENVPLKNAPVSTHSSSQQGKKGGCSSCNRRAAEQKKT